MIPHADLKKDFLPIQKRRWVRRECPSRKGATDGGGLGGRRSVITRSWWPGRSCFAAVKTFFSQNP